MKSYVFCALALVTIWGCTKKSDYDATGSFEAEEVIVSAEQTGKILSLDLEEGDTLRAAARVGAIDVSDLRLQKAQREAVVSALQEKTVDVRPHLAVIEKQLSIQKTQLEKQRREQQRLGNMVAAGAAPRKQLDDVNTAVEELEKQIAVTHEQMLLLRSNVATQNRTVLSEQAPAEKSVAIVEDQIQKGIVVNPIYGVVLTKYAFAGEYATKGKPLYKIANVAFMTLRAYVTGSQLTQIRLQQHVKVTIDDEHGGLRSYSGVITWISDKAEFTPKTIQTRDERSNLVYAVKIVVKNDGLLKIGMYGEVNF